MCPADAPPEDRRRAERVAVNMPFANLSGATFVRDLSANGVFVLADELVAVGTLIDLRFTVLVDDPVVMRARGRVVRHSDDPKGMGVEFTNLTSEMRETIDKVVSQKRPFDSGPPEEDALDREATKVHATEGVMEAKDVAVATVEVDEDGEEKEDPVEAAQTLIKLKPVDLDILQSADQIDEEDEP